ncbi:MAG: ribose-5-phosphate isomerase RpiA [Archaeoglobi archaeon]|jgi:ribose 5-phosphate isomerase A|nr:ribose-5-phosphate isomerase RpiA [Archaeoglobi archaeon]TDA30862.1 MAG: ribose 5-phosphate isomerase A [Archaeoglobi archaeon]
MNGKYNASKLALGLIKDGMTIGIGSGSTVEVFLNLLGERIKREGLRIYGIPSSYQSMLAGLKNGIILTDLVEREPDICIDGADQVDSRLNCIKGGGAALTREKILAIASKKVLILVDKSKLVEKLSMPVPVEVLPFAYGYVVKKLSSICKPKLREGKGKVGPIITDNGNFILDCDFGVIENPEAVEKELRSIAGVVENGIFLSELIDAVIVGGDYSAEIIKK